MLIIRQFTANDESLDNRRSSVQRTLPKAIPGPQHGPGNGQRAALVRSNIRTAVALPGVSSSTNIQPAVHLRYPLRDRSSAGTLDHDLPVLGQAFIAAGAVDLPPLEGDRRSKPVLGEEVLRCFRWPMHHGRTISAGKSVSGITCRVLHDMDHLC